MILERLYDEKLSQASWLLGCPATGEALVVDPLRDPSPYLELARRKGLRVTHVTETHVHADFVSGARELAAAAGAGLLLSGEGGEEWSYRFPDAREATLLEDGDAFAVGRIRVDVLHTPGHTPEHLTFVVTDVPSDPGEPVGAFTGDFLFVGDVGRPDLLERAAGKKGATAGAARDLFRSLRRLEDLPDHLQIWPGHGSGSPCGKSPGAVPQGVLGYERRVSWAFSFDDPDAFAEALLEGQPAPPTYYGRMKTVNRDGPEIRGGVPTPDELSADALLAELDGGALVVDLRSRSAFGEEHLPGSLNLPLNRSFTQWAGWLVPYDRTLCLVAEDEETAREAARDLFLIGHDRVAGWAGEEALERWSEDEGPLAEAPTAAPAEAARGLETGAVLLDVREPDEWRRGHVPGAVHIPLGELPERADEVPGEGPVYVYCASGARSAIAQSVLERAGRERVANVRGGFSEWEREGLPVER